MSSFGKRLGEGAYGLAVWTVRVLSPLLGLGSSKLARGVRGRRGAAKRLGDWARRNRSPDLPLVWSHAPSVGEGLQARAVLEALRERRALQAAFTHFSPSAEALAGTMPVEVADYLPWDLDGQMSRVLDALEPDLLAFTKTEVWPALARAAGERGVPMALVGATLPPGAGRLRRPARRLLRSAFERLELVAAIAGEDGERFTELGVSRDRIVVTGDPGVDSAARRASGADPEAPWLAPFHRDPRPTLVAGSTWAPDEEVLLPACRLARDRVEPWLRLIVAPHEPGDAHVAALESALEEDGWKVARLGEVEEEGSAESADAVVVDRVGVLAQLYTVGALAYVGGGFHDEGLHSVLEPAAAGLPVLFGPRNRNARAAADLVRCGGAREVSGTDELVTILSEWLEGEEARTETGEAARGYIDGHLGASSRTADLLLEILGRGDGSPG